MDFANYWFSSSSGGGGGYQIANSLRFRGAQYLERTNQGFGTTTPTGGVSCWVKFSRPVGNYTAGVYDNFIWLSSYTNLYRNGYGYLYARTAAGDTTWSGNPRFRDYSAWYHIFWQFKGSGGTSLYVNGVLFGNHGGTIGNGNGTWYVGRGDTYKMQGYLAEYHLVLGQAVNATDFGEFNDDGVWVPKEVSISTAGYGSAGFYLDFSDPANIGADRSGNGNNYTPTAFELTNTSSTDYDWMADSPTQNVPSWNPISYTTKKTYSEANRKVSVNGQQNGWTLKETQVSLHKLTGKQVLEIAFPAYYATNYNKATGVNVQSGGSDHTFAYWQTAQAAGNRNKVTLVEGGAVVKTWPSPGGTNTGMGSWFGLFYDGATGDLWPCVNNTNDEATSANWNPQWLLANGTFSASMPATAPYNFPDAEFYFAGLNNQAGGGAGPVFMYGSSKYEELEGSLPAGFEFASCSTMAAPNLPTTITGTFAGNSNANGPFVYTGCIPGRIQYGSVDVLYQNRLSQTNVDFLSNGFKVRSTTSNSGTVSYTVTTTHSGGEYSGKKVPFGGAGVSPAPACSN